jgi:hypothetical protein
MKATLCDGCVQKKRSAYWIVFVVLIILRVGLLCAFLGAIGSQPPRIHAIPCILGWLVFMGSIAGVTEIFKIVKGTKLEMGDRLAIDLYETKLRNDGYDSFFTREKYSSLHR